MVDLQKLHAKLKSMYDKSASPSHREEIMNCILIIEESKEDVKTLPHVKSYSKKKIK